MLASVTSSPAVLDFAACRNHVMEAGTFNMGGSLITLVIGVGVGFLLISAGTVKNSTLLLSMLLASADGSSVFAPVGVNNLLSSEGSMKLLYLVREHGSTPLLPLMMTEEIQKMNGCDWWNIWYQKVSFQHVD